MNLSGLFKTGDANFHCEDKNLSSQLKVSEHDQGNRSMLSLHLTTRAFDRTLIMSVTLNKNWSFPFRFTLVNMTKSAGNWEFGHIYWRNPWWNTSFFYAVLINFYALQNRISNLKIVLLEKSSIQTLITAKALFFPDNSS